MGSKKILVIDDQEIIYRMIHKTLSANGYDDIEYASNGLLGIEKDKENNYDLITCDITMPELDGLETSKRILENNPNKQILMITALGDRERVKQAIQTGIKYYLVKPFSPEKLLEKVNEALG